MKATPTYICVPIYKELIKNDKLKIGLDVAEDEDENNQECDT